MGGMGRAGRRRGKDRGAGVTMLGGGGLEVGDCGKDAVEYLELEETDSGAPGVFGREKGIAGKL
jgi:hypothetical protein